MEIGESGRAGYLAGRLIVVTVTGDFAEAAGRPLETVGEKLDILFACIPQCIAIIIRLYLPIGIAVFVLRLVRRHLRVVD